MECVELAPAFEPPHTSDSGSKLHALHTLRETDRRCSPPMQFASYPPENLRKKTRFSDILSSAPRRCGSHNENFWMIAPNILNGTCANFIFSCAVCGRLLTEK